MDDLDKALAATMKKASTVHLSSEYSPLIDVFIFCLLSVSQFPDVEMSYFDLRDEEWEYIWRQAIIESKTGAKGGKAMKVVHVKLQAPVLWDSHLEGRLGHIIHLLYIARAFLVQLQ